MSPTLFRDRRFRFFFFSREETGIHVHVAHPNGEAKFWMAPEIIVAQNYGLSNLLLREAEALIRDHEKEIHDAWRRHFSG